MSMYVALRTNSDLSCNAMATTGKSGFLKPSLFQNSV